MSTRCSGDVQRRRRCADAGAPQDILGEEDLGIGDGQHAIVDLSSAS